MQQPLLVAGAGLAGTLLALDQHQRGHPIEVWDDASGAGCSRVAAGLFNPLLGPRMSADPGGWDLLEPAYRRWEELLGTRFFHPLTIKRPWVGSKVTAAHFPRSGLGWSAAATDEGVCIEGGGWVNIPVLLDAARTFFRQQGLLREQRLTTGEAIGRRVVWCGGLDDFTSGVWGLDPMVEGRWQGIRGDVLTVEAPECHQSWISIGSRFLLPLGGGRFRWGATHEIDVVTREEKPPMRERLVAELCLVPGIGEFRVVDHQWGIRPASRSRKPLIGRHSQHRDWFLFNGFAGKGVSTIPRYLGSTDPLIWLY